MASDQAEWAFRGFMLAVSIARGWKPENQDRWLYLLREIATGHLAFPTNGAKNTEEMRLAAIETATLVLERLSTPHPPATDWP